MSTKGRGHKVHSETRGSILQFSSRCFSVLNCFLSTPLESPSSLYSWIFRLSHRILGPRHFWERKATVEEKIATKTRNGALPLFEESRIWSCSTQTGALLASPLPHSRTDEKNEVTFGVTVVPYAPHCLTQTCKMRLQQGIMSLSFSRFVKLLTLSLSLRARGKLRLFVIGKLMVL